MKACAVVLFSFCVALPALSQESADNVIGAVDGAAFQAYPVAIPDLRTAEKRGSARTTASGITSILRNDLTLSGAFNILSPKSYLDSDGIAQGSVKFEDWSNIGSNGLVKGKVTGTPDAFDVQIYVYQVAVAKNILSKKYSGTKSNFRSVAHAIADDVHRAFTGLPGVASTQITVVKKIGGAKRVIVMDADGENQRTLTKRGSLNLLPSWSPNGSKILFTSYRSDNPDLYEKPLRGGPARKISGRAGLNTGGRYAPDGRSIVVTLSKDGNSEIYKLNSSGKVQKRLTNSWGIDTSPTFSPDGKTIAFVSSRAGNPQIYEMPAAGGSAKRLTFQGTYNQTPAYDPQGGLIAFTARDERNKFDIFVYHRGDRKITRVTQGKGNNEDPSFSPNGNLIVFISDRSGTKQVWVSTIDGSVQKRVTTGGRYSSPSWGPFPR